ncbi:phosphotransferase family protein [Marininema halotolerans]|uniref:Aminoglycoside 2''-phosphotransferase n=1 Tax=Marininema halotolerans TaxID=1155944 RepID=A0A1I6QDY3_9BACL|nr:aminoglycoside phosphotransferase family protein [Marininema halotolerans]SFS50480.1 aminoglycoside 2''-phosphotransferase [Marininema halotolerans]
MDVVAPLQNWIMQKIPDLKIREWKMVESGWDNLIIVINHEWIVRFPRTKRIQKNLLSEKQLLDQIKKPLQKRSIEVPSYQLIYDASDHFPTCCYYPLIQGSPLHPDLYKNILTTSSNRKQIARTLGDFLAVIHSFNNQNLQGFSLEKPHTKAYWQAHWREIQTKIYPLLPYGEQQKVTHLFKNFLVNWDIDALPAVLIHGDLSYHHILFSKEKQKITGIIDFGDSQIGDPAYDFSGIYWDYGEAFFNDAFQRYCQHSFSYSTNDLYHRVVSFYGKRPIFHEILYALENQSTNKWKQKLHELRKSLL